MKKMSSQLTTLLGLCLLPFAVLAEDSLQALNKMSQAMSDLNYEVAFVQTSPTNMDSFRYRHIKQEQKVYAQLVTLDGEQQEIIQRDNLVSYFQPGSQAFTINSGYIVDALPAVIRTDFNKLNQYYDFIKMGKGRVAGRIVDTIRIVPKDDFRYQYLVFLDEDNGLLLRADMLDREGNLLDQFRVVTLYIDNRLRGLTDYLNKVSTPPFLHESKQESSFRINWKPDWLPQGFELVSQNQDSMNEEVIENALFSDGLFTFTLYVNKADRIAAKENTWRQGAYTIYSKVIGDKEITFIGQLPIATAKQIVQGVTFLK